jgi:hypothetical protein
MQRVIVFHSDLGCEVAPAALLRSFNDKIFLTCSHPARVKDDTDLNRFISEIKMEKNESFEVIFLGNYLKKYFDSIVSKLNVVKTQVYLFGKKDTEINSNYNPFSGNDYNVGPCKYTFDYLMNYLRKNSLVDDFKVSDSMMKAIKLFDDRLFHRNMDNTQILFTGLSNINTEKSLLDNTIDLFKNPESMKSIESEGLKILTSQLMVVRDRVKNNSKIVTLNTGIIASITEATELVNMTHEELQKVHRTDMTIVFCHKLLNNSIKYSLRSWKDTIDAQEYAKLIGGNGNISSAGGEVDFNLELPWAERVFIDCSTVDPYIIDGKVINECDS